MSTRRGASLRRISAPPDTPCVAASSNPASRQTNGTPKRQGERRVSIIGSPFPGHCARWVSLVAKLCVQLYSLSLHPVPLTVSLRYSEVSNAQVQGPQEERLHRQRGQPHAGGSEGRSVERVVHCAVRRPHVDRTRVVDGVSVGRRR